MERLHNPLPDPTRFDSDPDPTFHYVIRNQIQIQLYHVLVKVLGQQKIQNQT